MKKLLYQLDTDLLPSVFDNVVAHDGGADQVIPYGGITPDNMGPLVEGVIFTRAPKDKKNTAIFVGGSNLVEGESLFSAIQNKFFGKFRVSLMLDSNGANTTAAACVAWLTQGRPIEGKQAIVLGGTGPVGQRVAVMLGRAGAEVTLTGRQLERTRQVCAQLNQRYGLTVAAAAAPDLESRGQSIQGKEIVVSTGASGVTMLEETQWAQATGLELIADANASPPVGIGGIDMTDRATLRHGVLCFGPLGFGALKLALHRECIGRLFDSNDLVLDAEAIFERARILLAASL
ncbi:NADP-dependent methylenetetrahydromethanopterin/methylenetetrahydrofolate dehydrogenase [Ferrovum myxofaciens]|nr:bifunctional protein MdtA [Ferrovum myxofaciens]NDU90882.1 methylenetetrahydrofolate dehydrogenase [Ferrovum sp.]